MATEITDFQRPAPDTEYKELLPLVIKPGNPPVILDPNSPDDKIIVQRAVVCCECVNASTTVCIPEQTAGAFMTLAGGQTIGYWFA